MHTMPIAVVQLDGDAVVRKVRNCCGHADFKDWKPEIAPDHEVPSYIPTLKLEASDIETENICYERNYPIDEAVLKLRSYDALVQLGQGQATKIIVPSDIQNIAGLATSIAEVVKK